MTRLWRCERIWEIVIIQQNLSGKEEVCGGFCEGGNELPEMSQSAENLLLSKTLLSCNESPVYASCVLYRYEATMGQVCYRLLHAINLRVLLYSSQKGLLNARVKLNKTIVELNWVFSKSYPTTNTKAELLLGGTDIPFSAICHNFEASESLVRTFCMEEVTVVLKESSAQNGSGVHLASYPMGPERFTWG